MRTYKLAGFLASVGLAAAALVGCSSSDNSASESASSGSGSGSGASSAAAAVDGSQKAAAVLADNQDVHAEAGDTDADGEGSDVVGVELNGDSASSDGDGVSVDGATVTITAAGVYRIGGSLDDGQLVVTAPEAKVTLILDGAKIANSKGAAIDVTAADEVVVVLAEGSENTLGDTDTYAEDAKANAALHSAADLTIGGSGSLTVKGNGADGITSTDGLVIQGGTLTVDAADDGIRGKDYVVVSGGTVTVTAKGDGLRADNTEDADRGYIAVSGGTVKVTSAGDGIDAATDLVVTDGKVTVTSEASDGSDGSSPHGMKSGVITVLEGGSVDVTSTADAVHGDGAVHLGGAATTLSAGDDGVHAEGDLVISAGTVRITRSNEGLEGKDILVSGGSTDVTSGDDGVNASGSEATSDDQGDQGGFGGGGPGGGGGGEGAGDYTVKVTGGTLVIDAEGDGLDSNGNAEITGGTVVVNGPERNGNGALDVNGALTVGGGSLLAAGSAGMVVAPDAESGQGWLSATLDTAVQAGTTVHIADSGGKVVASYVTSKAVQNIVYSGKGIENGEEYTVHTGGSTSGTDTGGLAGPGELGSAAKIATVTAGEAPEGGGFGGGGGGGGRP